MEELTLTSINGFYFLLLFVVEHFTHVTCLQVKPVDANGAKSIILML